MLSLLRALLVYQSENCAARSATFPTSLLLFLLPDLNAAVLEADHQSAIWQLDKLIGTSFHASVR